jgi:hypothetical protein
MRLTEYFGFPEHFDAPAIKRFREATIIRDVGENLP